MRGLEIAILILLAIVGAFGLMALKFYNENTELQSQVQSLQSRISELQQENEQLRSTKSTLEERLRALEHQLNEIMSRPEQESRIVLNDEVVTIPARDIWAVEIPAERPGIIVVTYQASGDINIGLAWEHGGIQFHDEKQAGTSGTIAFPVLPSQATLYVINPALLSGVTVTLTVEYIYWT